MSAKTRINQREFLLGFFKPTPQNENIELNGFILFKHWDGNNNRWTVDIFSQESWKAMKTGEKVSIQKERLF